MWTRLLFTVCTQTPYQNFSALGTGNIIGRLHEKLRHLLATTARGGRASREQWDAMYICEDAVNSPRKKPEPGLNLEACKDFEVDPSEALMIGDSWSDVVAAQRAGCVGVLVGRATVSRFRKLWQSTGSICQRR
jgi:histidinol phosphatase-like enzyme